MIPLYLTINFGHWISSPSWQYFNFDNNLGSNYWDSFLKDIGFLPSVSAPSLNCERVHKRCLPTVVLTCHLLAGERWPDRVELTGRLDWAGPQLAAPGGGYRGGERSRNGFDLASLAQLTHSTGVTGQNDTDTEVSLSGSQFHIKRWRHCLLSLTASLWQFSILSLKGYLYNKKQF